MRRKWTQLVVSLLAVTGASAPLHAAISYNTSGNTISQDFDTLPTTGGSLVWANDSTLTGWSLFRQPTPGTAITAIAIGTGSSTAGSFYSFGAASAADRALGGLGSGGTYFGSPASGNVAGWIAVAITNDTGAGLASFEVKYDGEQWRNGGKTTQDTMVLEYGFGATFGAVASWTAAGAAFDFTGPIASATAAALDGNAGANRIADVGGTVGSLTWNNGDTLWIRWIEQNEPNNDHGLSLDNFRFKADAVPAPGAVVLLGMSGVMITRRRR